MSEEGDYINDGGDGGVGYLDDGNYDGEEEGEGEEGEDLDEFDAANIEGVTDSYRAGGKIVSHKPEKTSPFMSKYEFVKILSERVEELSKEPDVFYLTDEEYEKLKEKNKGILTTEDIAKEEILLGKIPKYVDRELGGNLIEKIPARLLKIPEEYMHIHLG